MLLNSLSQAFVVSFDLNFFYPSINEYYIPEMRRQWLCYNTVEDFMNSQISSVTFPGFSTQNVQQNIGLNPIQKRPAKQTDEVIDKTLTLTIKTTESLLSYFICRSQYSEFIKLGRYMSLYMPDIRISLLNDGGFETFTYVYHQLTPTNISQLELSYAARLGSFNTFTWQFSYNFYDIWSTDSEGRRKKLSDIYVPQYDGPKEIIDTDAPQYQQMRSQPISTKSRLRELAKTFNVNGSGKSPQTVLTPL